MTINLHPLQVNPLAHFFKKHKDKFLKHKDKFIWMHSLYALAFGVGVMWLGSRNFGYIRLAIVELTFIWLSGLAIPSILANKKINLQWKHRIRLSINYFNRNFYQQLLFFVLPIYYMSSTPGSLNMLFIVLVGVSAVFSTMDIVYDRYISVKATIMSLFFAFNLFAAINAMLPILWGVRSVQAIRFSGLLAFLGFATFCFRLSDVKAGKKWLITAIAAVMIFVVSELGRPFIPPAPLRLEKALFGETIDMETREIRSPLLYLPGGTRKIYVLTVIKTQLMQRERIQHTWYLEGKKIYTSGLFRIMGGGKNGFRLWTYFTLKQVFPGSTLRVDVKTEGGQLVGRAYLGPKLPAPTS